MAKTLALLLAGAAAAGALVLDVGPGRKRCLSEVLSKHDLVKGEYTLLEPPTNGERSGVEVKVLGPNDAQEFLQRDEVSSKFSFTAAEGGAHRVCFTNVSPYSRRVELRWAAGAATIDYTEMAKKEHLRPLEVELRRLEDRLDAVQKEMQYQREREEQHRDMSEVTNGRVMWFSLLTILIVVVQGTLQVWHLYSFFRKRKYIGN